MSAHIEILSPPMSATSSPLRTHFAAARSETPLATAKRWFLGTVYALKPGLLAEAPLLFWHVAKDWLRGGTEVPTRPLADKPDGFAASAAIFAPRPSWPPPAAAISIIATAATAEVVDPLGTKHPALKEAISPSASAADPRRRLHGHLRHRLRGRDCALRSTPLLQLAFPHWITPGVVRLYTELHARPRPFLRGLVARRPSRRRRLWHRFGCMFTTESQFSLEPNTSKIGFAVLNYHLARWGFISNDGKDPTPTTVALGFRPHSARRVRGSSRGAHTSRTVRRLRPPLDRRSLHGRSLELEAFMIREPRWAPCRAG